MATSWTPLLSSSGVFLLLLLLCESSARAATMRGQQTRVSAEEAGRPLALLLLRAVGSAASAPGPTAADSFAGVAGTLGLDGLDPGEDLDAYKAAVMEAASSRDSSVRSASSDGTAGDVGDTVFLRAAKRQVRYHQCYFNPISCFG